MRFRKLLSGVFPRGARKKDDSKGQNDKPKDASTGAKPEDTPTLVVLDITAPFLVFGNHHFKITGTLRPCASEKPIRRQTITLKRADDKVKDFSDVLDDQGDKSVKTGRAGQFKMERWEQARGTYYYEAAYAGSDKATKAGSDEYAEATSNEVKVKVVSTWWYLVPIIVFLSAVLALAVEVIRVAPSFISHATAWWSFAVNSSYFGPVLLIIVLLILAFLVGLFSSSSSPQGAWGNILMALGFLLAFALAIVFAMSANAFAATDTAVSWLRIVSWLLLIAVISALVFYLGQTVLSAGTSEIDTLQKLLGILVDGRNRVSLARLQVAIWTILILATFAEAALANIISRADNPIGIVTIPINLGLILGISVIALPTSNAVAYPNVRADDPTVQKSIDVLNKKGTKVTLLPETKPVTTSNGKQTEAQNGEDKDYKGKVQAVEITRPNGRTEAVVLNGTIVARHNAKDAKLTDVLTGDEISNYGYIDLSKVQLFLFNVVLIIVYAVGAAYYLTGGLPFQSLPNVPDLMAQFLAVSNAGYLAYKIIPGLT
jgi:hypothetical protein